MNYFIHSGAQTMQMILGNNLHHLMKVHGNLTVNELSRLTRIPQPTLHHILSGVTKKPRKKALQSIANFFSITIDQLTGITALPNTIPESIKNCLKIRTIPIINWNIVGEWPIQNISEHGFSELLLESELAPDSFALVLENRSMEPIFPKDSLLIFDAEKIPNDRDFVIVYLRKNCGVTFNRLLILESDYYIKQTTSTGEIQLIKLDLLSDRIIAVLAEARVKY